MCRSRYRILALLLITSGCLLSTVNTRPANVPVPIPSTPPTPVIPREPRTPRVSSPAPRSLPSDLQHEPKPKPRPAPVSVEGPGICALVPAEDVPIGLSVTSLPGNGATVRPVPEVEGEELPQPKAYQFVLFALIAILFALISGPFFGEKKK